MMCGGNASSHFTNIPDAMSFCTHPAGCKGGDAPPASVSINDEDMQAFMEASYGLENDGLDPILHSPGDSLEAAEAIVSYLRSRFGYVVVDGIKSLETKPDMRPSANLS